MLTPKQNQTLVDIYQRIYRKIHAHPHDWIIQLNGPQLGRVRGVVALAAKSDQAAWSSLSWLSEYEVWLRGMRTRRIRSLKAVTGSKHHAYMLPLWDVAAIIADEPKMAVPMMKSTYKGVGTVTGRWSSKQVPGHRYDWIVFDEAAKISPEIWDIAMKKKERAMRTHTVAVQFVPTGVGRSVYHYLTNDDSIEPGDYATVWSPVNNGPALVQVETIYWDSKSPRASKYLIGKIDLRGYYAQEDLRKREEIRRQAIASRKVAVQKKIRARQEEIRLEILKQHYDEDTLIGQLQEEMNQLELDLRYDSSTK